MVTIDTSEDIVRALREDPHLLDQVRRAVMTDEVLALPNQFAALLETQNEILRRLGNLDTRFGDLDHDYRNFRGNYAENAARKRAPSIAMYLDESENLGIDELTIAVLSGPDILALAGEYGSDRLATISRETRRSFYEADLIIRADKTDGSTFYIAVEASYTCDERDTTRAMSHSRLITEFTGNEAWPAIAGVRLNWNIKPLINSGEVFWFSVEDDDLEP